MLDQLYTKDQVGIVIGREHGSSASNHDLVGRWVRGIDFENVMRVGLVYNIRNTEDGVVVDVLTDTPVTLCPASFSCSLMVATVEQVCHQCKGAEFTTAASGGHMSFYMGDVSDSIEDRPVCAQCGEDIVFAQSTYKPEEETYEIPL